MQSLDTNEKSPFVLVVGYDGTDPSQRALQRAAKMLQDRSGRIEVVFVAHVPANAGFAAQALVALEEGFDDLARQLAKLAEETLSPTGTKWHFQRRNGEIAPELLLAGQEQLDAGGPNTHVVLVVGGSASKIDRYLNSTPARMIRKDRFEVFVVP